jgi:hypothetical protein
VWSPYNASKVAEIKRVQGSFTKKLPGLADLRYNDRLISFDAESLGPKWVCLNLILAYMKQFDLIYINAGNYFLFANSGCNTREHSYTLLTPGAAPP